MSISPPPNLPMVTFTLSVSGLRCNNCAIGLEKTLNTLNQTSANVSYAAEKITLSCPQQQLTNIIDTVIEAGYKLTIEHHRFDVDGWSCSRCADKTFEQLKQATGLSNIAVNSATNTLSFDRFSDLVSLENLEQIISELGYKLTADLPKTESKAAHKKGHLNKLNWNMILAIAPTSILVLPMLAMMFNYTLILNPWLQLALASVVQFIVGAKFYRGAWRSLKSRQANMDTLVALGTSAAFFYSCYVLLFMNGADRHFYFETSAVVITFVTIGKWLENKAKYSAGEAMRELLALSPINANVIINHQVIETPLEQVITGQFVRVFSGAKIPVDGIITSGISDIDESLISGESLPVTKNKGDKVYAGALNGQGILEIEVTAVGDNSSLSQIIYMVEQAQSTKAPIEKLVDTIASWFVPTVLMIAALTFGGWLMAGYSFETALINSVAVLVVACPCALGLATPAAIVVGCGVAAKHGVIIRDPQALQVAGNIDTVAFDKTGTLTVGAPALIDSQWFDEAKQTENIALLKSMVEHSDHPLSVAISGASFLQQTKATSLFDYQVHAGLGLYAKNETNEVLMGNQTLLSSRGIDLKLLNHNSKVAHHSSVVLFAVNNQLIAQFFLQDEIRPQSAAVISSLNKQHINTLMLSGDTPSTAQHVAKKLAMTKFYGALKPQDKLDRLQLLQRQGACVAMVGDGINDAPALAQANLGIAMGGGTQVAISSAQITIMQDDPMLVTSAIKIAKATWRTVKQNLALAFIFNSCAIPAAAMGYLTPQLAGLAMALSSVTVLMNALLLKQWKNKEKKA